MGNGEGLFGRRIAKSAGVEVDNMIPLCEISDTLAKRSVDMMKEV